MSSSNLNAPEMSLREDLISTAIKFLSNPKIQRSPLEQKRNFLLSKGLTEDEIQKAFERGASLLAVPMASELFMYKHSRVAWLRELFLNVLLFGGLSYSLYWIYKKWIESLLFGNRTRRKSTEERIIDLKKSIETMMNDLKQEIITVRSEVDRLNNIQIANTVTRGQIENLKSDIASVKGILLSRNQFPALRTEHPSIPAWQFQSQQARNDSSPPHSDHEKDTKEHDDDILRVRGDRSESEEGGSHSSEGEVVTKNSDSSLEIIVPELNTRDIY